MVPLSIDRLTIFFAKSSLDIFSLENLNKSSLEITSQTPSEQIITYKSFSFINELKH